MLADRLLTDLLTELINGFVEFAHGLLTDLLPDC
jgi:hypothetical protein